MCGCACVGVCVWNGYTSPTHWVCLYVGVSMYGLVCVFVSKRRRHRTLAIDKQQQRTFLFLFFSFFLYFEHPVQQRDGEKGEIAARVNVDKLGACL